MNILLANLGNRNITYKGKDYPSFRKDKKSLSFRNWTEKLLRNFDKEEHHLALNILDKLLDKKIDSVSKIILIASDQALLEESNNKRQVIESDTLHEGEIVKKLIFRDYQFSNVEVKICKKSVVNNNHLMIYYRGMLKRILKQDFKKILICDAGGTPQQKSALKIICEFCLPPEKHEIYYVSSHDHNLQLVKQEEYRKILSIEQAIKVLTSGNYGAALNLLDINFEETGKIPIRKKLLLHVFYRFTGYLDKAKHILPESSQKPMFKNFIDGKSEADNIRLQKFIGKKLYFVLTNKLYKVKFYYSIKDWSNTVLSLSQFYEYLFNEVCKLEKESQIVSKFNTHFKDFLLAYNKGLAIDKRFSINLKNSVGSQVMALKVLNNETLNKISDLLSPHLSYTSLTMDCTSKQINKKLEKSLLNIQRNNIAHRGKFIRQSDKDKHLSYLDQLIVDLSKVWGCTYDNLFLELNKICEKELRK